MLDAIAERRASVLGGVPAMLHALLATHAARPTDTTSLQVVISGGDAVPAALIDACASTFGAGFTTVYGQTGLSPIVTATGPADTGDDRYTAGRPLENVELAVLDRDGSVLPVGQGGICARLPGAWPVPGHAGGDGGDDRR